MRFAAGPLDNLVGGSGGDAVGVCGHIRKVLSHPISVNIQSLYQRLLKQDAITLVDKAISILRADPPDWHLGQARDTQ